MLKDSRRHNKMYNGVAVTHRSFLFFSCLPFGDSLPREERCHNILYVNYDQNVQLEKPQLLTIYLLVENCISQFGSDFALIVLAFCKKKEVWPMTAEIGWTSSLQVWSPAACKPKRSPTFRKNKDFFDEIWGEGSHFAVLHTHPPAVFNLLGENSNS